MTHSTTVLFGLFALGLCTSLYAESNPNLQKGFSPFGAFQVADVDSVDLSNGNVNLRIPLPSYTQRGALSLDFFLLYSGKSYQRIQSCNPATGGCFFQWVGGGTSPVISSSLSYAISLESVCLVFGDPDLGCQFWSIRSIVHEPNGSSHRLHDTAAGWRSINGSGFRSLGNTASSGATLGVFDRFGTKHYSSFWPNQWNRFIEDSNGNTISVFPANPTTQIMDTVDRTMEFPAAIAAPDWGTPSDASGCTGPLPTVSAKTLALLGPLGSTLVLKFCYVNVPLKTNFPTGDEQVVSHPLNLPVMLQSLLLPNGTSWIFEYNSRDPGDPADINYGDLTRITLPTGGTISYVWRNKSFCVPDPNDSTSMSRTLVSRTVDANDGTGPHSFNYDYAFGLNSVTTTVTDPLNNQTVHQFSDLGGCAMYETRMQVYDGPAAGAPLKTVETQYIFNPASNSPEDFSIATAVFPVRYKTILADGKVAMVERDYDPGFGVSFGNGLSMIARYGNVMEEREYDFGSGAPGPLIRKTKRSYTHLGNITYRDLNLLELTAFELVCSPTVPPETADADCGTGLKQRSRTDYGYDHYGSSNQFGHSLALVGSGISTQHVVPPNGNARGNRTSVNRWLNQPTPATLSTTTSFLDTGMVNWTEDPQGHRTTFFYAANLGGAYITQTQNAVGHTTQANYDFNTGLLTSSTDANNKTTTFVYDAMWRIKEQNFPDTGQTKFDYVDTFSVNSPNVRVDVLLNPNGTGAPGTHSGNKWSSSWTQFDGLGRPIRTAKDNGLPEPFWTDQVDTCYDPLGRKSFASYPFQGFGFASNNYFCNNSQRPGDTVIYDALDRVKTVTRSDGSILAAEYIGNRTTVTDEAGKLSRGYSDAVGRLVRVEEPSGAPGVATQASGSVNISGTDRNKQLFLNKVPGSGSVTVNGGQQPPVTIETDTGEGCTIRPPRCPPPIITTIYDSGTVSITITANGTNFTKSAFYNQSSNTTTIANALRTAINNDGARPVDAGGTGATITITARDKGVGTNYPLSTTYSWNSTYFVNPSFTSAASGPALTGGNDGPPTTTWDTGTVAVTVGSTTKSRAYDQNSAPAQLATDLAGQFNSDAAAPATATVSGSTISFLSKSSGLSANVTLAVNSVTNNPNFSGTSFPASKSGENLSGGLDPTNGLEAPAVTLYSYGAFDNLTRVEQRGTASSCDANCRLRTFEYDSLSRLTRSTNPESGTINFGYDNDNNLTSQIAPAPNQQGSLTVTTSLSYDAIHRLTNKSFSTGGGAGFVYDQSTIWGVPIQNSIGRLSGRFNTLPNNASWVGVVNSYDALGRTVYQNQFNQRTGLPGQVNQIFNYDYNVDGSPKSLTFPSGRRLDYTYNIGRRAISMVDGTTNYVTNASYTGHGALSGYTNGAVSGGFAGINRKILYNVRLQPDKILAMTGTPDPGNCAAVGGKVLHFNYTYFAGNNGNISGIFNCRNANRSQLFTYDQLNRVSTARSAATSGADCWGESFGYDLWGNLTSRGITQCMGEGPVPAATVSNQMAGSSYDAAGNLLCTGCSYDAENQLVSAPGISFDYDALGRRVKKSSGTLYWQGLGGEVLQETDLAGILKREFIYFNGKRTARRDAPSGAVHYYFSDHRGSSNVVTNAVGVIEEESDFYPFGGERAVVDTLADQNYKFTGTERDTETNFDYFEARYYDFSLGRFTSVDPGNAGAELTDPQTWNAYSYARNNPIVLADPTGLGVCTPAAGGHDATAPNNATDKETCEKSGGTWNYEMGDPQTVRDSSRRTETVPTPATFVEVTAETDGTETVMYTSFYLQGSDLPIDPMGHDVLSLVSLQTGWWTKQANCAGAFAYPFVPGLKPEDMEDLLGIGSEAAGEGLESASESSERKAQKLARAKQKGTAQASRVEQQVSKVYKHGAMVMKGAAKVLAAKEGVHNWNECQNGRGPH